VPKGCSWTESLNLLDGFVAVQQLWIAATTRVLICDVATLVIMHKRNLPHLGTGQRGK